MNDDHEIILERILRDKDLHAVFQPILDFSTSSIFGYEALIRGPANNALHSPVILFEVAKRAKKLAALEIVCREVSCKSFRDLQLPGKLFLNFSPMTLIDPEHQKGITKLILAEQGLDASSIVIELSEQYPLEDFTLLKNATEHYRNMGFEIAIDDLGAGYSGLRTWSELRPDYVKIDRHFIEDIHNDKVKWEFVRSIQEVAYRIGTRVIAEGIEVEDELKTIKAMDIRFAQGFYLGRPEASPSVSPRNEVIYDTSKSITERYFSKSSTLEPLVQSTITTTSNTLLTDVADSFIQKPRLNSVVVVDDGIAKGIVSRTRVLELLSLRYGRELFGRKAVADHIEVDSIDFDIHTPLSEVSKTLTCDPRRDMNLDFIITNNGRYVGVGKVRDLLSRLTDLQVESARYKQPLTQLPGNVPICSYIDEVLVNDEDFYVAYFDLNFFKPFNDYFGYKRGDEVILCLAGCLLESIDNAKDFLGHIGGDDFIVIFKSSDWWKRCENVVERFEEKRNSYYNQETLEAGGIWSLDRKGKEQFFGLLSLSVGIVNPDPKYCKSHHDVSNLAADAKHHAKSLGGGKLFVSRRRRPNIYGYSEEQLQTSA